MGTRKRYQTLLLATLPHHARDLILHVQMLNYIHSKNDVANSQFQKPSNSQYHRYKNYRTLLRLRYWQITQQGNSMIQAHYAQKPKNPE